MSSGVEVLITRLDPGLPLPSQANPADAGYDLYSRVETRLAPGQRQAVPTGVAIALPEGYAAFIHPRSGIALKAGIGMVNPPGTVDAGYRGELQVILINHDPAETFDIRRGDRIAQLVVQRVESVCWVEAAELPDSSRGIAGFGSSGGASGLGGAA